MREDFYVSLEIMEVDGLIETVGETLGTVPFKCVTSASTATISTAFAVGFAGAEDCPNAGSFQTRSPPRTAPQLNTIKPLNITAPF